MKFVESKKKGYKWTLQMDTEEARLLNHLIGCHLPGMKLIEFCNMKKANVRKLIDDLNNARLRSMKVLPV